MATAQNKVADGKKVRLSSQEMEMIERGLKDVEEGRVYTHAEVMDQVKKKFPQLFK